MTADIKSVNRNRRSREFFEQAVKLIPGGVNSPVRAFRSVCRDPLFIESAEGAYITDADGNRYIDYVGSWGPMILGHAKDCVINAVTAAAKKGLSFGAATEAELTMAKLLCSLVPSLEMVRMVNSGTEATMSALRLARGFTGRDKIIKFAGCYHGHSDALLVKAGSGLLSGSTPDSAGVTPACAAETLVAEYNDLDSVEKLFDNNKKQIAAVIVEPVAANMGVVLPAKGFLEGLCDICKKESALLIFDEVITGFRLGITGAQGYFGIKPDLSCFGKIIGGGMPVGAYGGRSDIMSLLAPIGPVYQAGTLSGNPVAVSAGIAQLGYLKEHPQVYTRIASLGNILFGSLNEIVGRRGKPCSINYIGSIGSLFFTPAAVNNFTSALKSDTASYAAYFGHLLDSGIYTAPAQFEALFISDAHSEAEINKTLNAAEDFFKSRASLQGT